MQIRRSHVPSNGAATTTSVSPSPRRVPTLLAALLAMLLLGGIAAGQRSPATAQEATPDARAIEATAQRFYDAFNTGDVDTLDEVFAPDWAAYPAPAGEGTDLENVKGQILAFRVAFPDLLVQTEDFVVEGNQVVVRSTVTGTHEGTFLGVPATGRPFATQFIDIHRVEGGRIVDTYHVEDLLGVFFQVGAFPPLAGPADATPAA